MTDNLYQMRSEAFVTPSILEWAIDRSGRDREKIARSASVSVDRLTRWLQGESHPTVNQALNLSSALRVPFGYLFLSKPPKEDLPIPDFRKHDRDESQTASAELIDLLNNTLQKQHWYRETLLQEEAQELPFVGSHSLKDEPDQVAFAISTTLELTPSKAHEERTWDSFLTAFTRICERERILVFRSGVVGNNTHRPLDVAEFRGFAMADDIAPVIFINTRDSVAARIFTLAHEVAHIWIGSSGISDSTPADHYISDEPEVEDFCNRTAASLLMPESAFAETWRSQSRDAENLGSVAKTFKVSTVAVLRRGLDLGLVDRDLFFQLLETERSKQTPVRSSGGGSYANNILSRHSRRFTQTLVSAALDGRASKLDAARMLDVTPDKLPSIELALQR